MDPNYSFDDADFLLKRDWFVLQEDIEELVDVLHDDVFWGVFENRRSYSPRVQQAFYLYEKRPASKVRNITNQMMEEKWKDEYVSLQKRYREQVQGFNAPPRPRTMWDDIYDTLQTRLNSLYAQLEKYTARPNYYAGKIQTLHYEIQTVKNEFDELHEKIVAQDKDWKELQWIESVLRVSASAI